MFKGSLLIPAIAKLNSVQVRLPFLFHNLSEKHGLLKILCFTLDVGGIPRIAKG